MSAVLFSWVGLPVRAQARWRTDVVNFWLEFASLILCMIQLSDGTWWRGHLSAADTVMLGRCKRVSPINFLLKEDRVGGIPGLSVSLSAARPEGYCKLFVHSHIRAN